MGLQLQLKNGKIKKYRTWYSESKTEYSKSTYKAKCGMTWDKMPSFDTECNHIDCAIDAIERKISSSSLFWMALIEGIIFVAISKGKYDFFLILGIIYILIGIFIAINWYYERRTKLELIEFRDLETINGINARKI